VPSGGRLTLRTEGVPQNQELAVSIVVGFDVHRAQITFDALDGATGEVTTGRISPADRQGLRRFLRRWKGRQVEAAVEATTGWRFVVEELQRAGVTAFLAQPAETSARRGPKRRAKTDRRDARHLRDLLLERRLPLAWIPPQHILELRAQVRLRKTLVDARTEWLQRIHAVLFHHGAKLAVSRLDGRDAREQLVALSLAPSACQQIEVALAMVEHVNAQLARLDRELKTFARRQPGCRALMRHYGIGPQVACAILAELGDARRCSSSRQAVRFAGLDVTVHESDDKRRPWALVAAGPGGAALGRLRGRRIGLHAHLAYYLQLKQRVGQNRAVLSVARKLLRRAHQTLRELGDEALQPAT
jgi:transposase